MSVDIASLVFEVDARPVEAAAEKLDRLVAAADRADKAQKNLSSGSAEGARSATAFAESMGAIERATLSATTGATAFARAQREMLAEQRGIAQATAAYNRLRAELDPLEAIEAKLAQRTATLNTAFEKGAIDVNEYNTMLTRVTKAAADGVEVHGRYAGSAKLTSNQLQNLSYQLNDVVTGLVSGQKPLQIMEQQGGQIFQAFQMGPGGVGGALKAVGALAVEFAPLIAVLAVVAGGALALASAFHDAKTVTDENKTAIKDLADAQGAYSKTAEEAARTTGKLHDMLVQDTIEAKRNAEAKRNQAQQNLAVAQTALAAAKATLAQTMAANPNATPTAGVAQAMGALYQGLEVQKQQKQYDELSKALHGYELDVERLKDTLSSGGRSMVESLQRQNAEYGKSRGAVILMNAAIVAGKPENAAYRDQIMEQARAAAAHADAEDRRKGAVKASRQEDRDGAEASRAAATQLKQDFADLDSLTKAAATPAEQAVMKLNGQYTTLDGLLQRNIVDQKQYNDLVLALHAREMGPKVEAAAKPDLKGFSDANEAAIEFERRMEAVNRAVSDGFRDLNRDVGDLYYALHDHNWGFALAGLLTALKDVNKQIGFIKTNWSSMTKEQQLQSVAGIAGVANTIGQAVGGSTGGFISGAAGGALAGFQFGGLIGAGIGGVVGGIASLFGSSKAKKQQREQEEAQAAADAAAEAEQIATQHRQLEIQVMQLQGDAAGALTASRQAELAAMDESNRALAQQVYDLQDAQALREKEIELMQATGDAAGALAAQRQLELAAMTPAVAALQQQIYAAQDAQAAAQAAADAAAKAQQEHDAQVADLTSQLTTAYNAQSSALTDTIQKVTAFRDSVLDFQRSLNTGDLNGAGLAASYRAAAADFYATGPLAKANDPAAQARIVQVEQTFLAASKASASDQLFYLRDLAAVKALNAELVTTANNQIDTATAQLNGINATVAGLIDVKGAVNAVNGSVVDLANSLRALMAGTKTANDNGSSGGGGSASNDPFQGQTGSMLTEYFRQQAAGETYEQTLLNRKSTVLDLVASTGMAYNDAVNYAVANHLPGYASGGNHPGGARLVGEYGPEIEVTGPSRIWNARQTAQMLGGDNSDVVDAIGALTETIAEQQRTMKDMARDMAQFRRDFSNVTHGGEAMLTKDAA